MASGNVWGIDIGQCGLKALRGALSADGSSIEIDSFDYIEYPKILSQPDANPKELIQAALKTFTSRNDLRGDKVAISLPGQSGLSKFIKLPPVDAKQLPQLVGFEAKQQIPFDLTEVVWDYQRMPGEYGPDSDEDDDIPMPTEVGLFAIKRDQLLRAIRPLVDADIEIDVIQLTPMALYNAISYDLLQGDQPYNEQQGGTWIASLSIGTEAADLVITNGYRVWQRSVPIGGNHFTKQLTQDLKLTFAKAELVKRSARQSEDAKQLFKTMRPVFNDLVTETQRSIGYFGSLEKSAEVARLVLMGNAAKLPGLPQFLSKNLGMPVTKLESFDRIVGAPIDDTQFKENLLAFPVCYGLVLQGLEKSQLRSNLVPREIVRSRMIRRKKPWAAAIAATVMLACAFNFFLQFRGYDEVHPNNHVDGVSWEDAAKLESQLVSKVSQMTSEDTRLHEDLKRLNGLGEATVGTDDGRRLWLELLKTVTDCLPIDPNAIGPDGEPASIKDRPLAERKEIYIDSIESQYLTDLNVWNTQTVQALHQEFLDERNAAIADARRAAAGENTDEEGDPDAAVDEVPDAEGAIDSDDSDAGDFAADPGWVIQISGHHFQRRGRNKDKQYVRMTLLEQLEFGKVRLPMPNGQIGVFTAKEMGIWSPILVSGKIDKSVKIPNPDYRPPRPDPTAAASANPFAPAAATTGPTATEKDPENPQFFYGEQFSFVVQFVWKQEPLTQRLVARKALADAKRRAEDN